MPEQDPRKITPSQRQTLNREAKEHMKQSAQRLDELRSEVPGVVSYGAANYPHDPDFWAADWRELLAPNDPRRQLAIQPGTEADYRSMQRAHRVARKAFGLPAKDLDGPPHS